jgi:signal transduction histidine kinase
VEEALTNVRKHAEATEVSVEIEFGWRRLRLTVHDNGRGFDISDGERLAGHWGLLGMRERASRIRARLRITSGPGVGTNVVVDAPRRSSILTWLGRSSVNGSDTDNR